MIVYQRLYREVSERCGDDFRSSAKARLRIAGTLQWAHGVLGHEDWARVADEQINALEGAARTAVPAPGAVDPETVVAILRRAREVAIEEAALAVLAEAARA